MHLKSIRDLGFVRLFFKSGKIHAIKSGRPRSRTMEEDEGFGVWIGVRRKCQTPPPRRKQQTTAMPGGTAMIWQREPHQKIPARSTAPSQTLIFKLRQKGHKPMPLMIEFLNLFDAGL
jgi:hypothetical protein